MSLAPLRLGSRGFSTLVASLALAMPLWAPASASSQPSGDGVTLVPGAIVDVANGAVYLMAPGGDIESLQLQTGALNWRSDEADKPLALVNGRLVGQVDDREATAMRVSLLDVARSGQKVGQAELELPAGLRAQVDDGLGSSFAISVGSSAGSLALSWTYSEHQFGGAELEAGARTPLRNESGSWSLDPATGVGRTAPPGSPTNRPPSSRPDLADGERLASVEGIQFVSRDGAYVLSSTPLERGASGETNYRWNLYERSSGRQVGSIEASVPYLPFLVVGDVVLLETLPSGRLDGDQWVETPRALRAFSLVNGSELWQQPIRDTVYRGPFPS